MQLSRIAIAAAFLVVGLLIVVPMVMDTSSTSNASSSTPSVSPSSTPSPTHTKTPSHKPTHRPSPTHTTHTTKAPPPPTAPLKVTIGAVRCPGRSVLVTVANHSKQTEDYAITTDGSISVADRIAAGATRKSTLTVKEDHDTTVAVTWHNVPVKTLDRTADCTRKTKGKALPHTGPDSGMIIARVATGLAAMLTGLIIFWYGRQWPRRRAKMFDDD